MIELDFAHARIGELHREAAAHSLARSATAKPKPARRRPIVTAAKVEFHTPVGYSAANGWIG